MIADQASLDAEADPQLHGEAPQPSYPPRKGRTVEPQTKPVEPVEPDETPVETGELAEPAAEPEPKPRQPRRAALILGPGGGIVPAPLLAELIAHGATVRFLGAADGLATDAYRPGAALDRFIRCRDMTCRFPGCDRPATHADIDHTVPYPLGATHPANTKCYCRQHHLLKTFWDGWTERQTPDARLHLISPTGHTYTTAPLSALLFPSWNTRTGPPPPTARHPQRPTPGRHLMMPTRHRSRTENRAAYIRRERELNARERTNNELKQQPPQHNRTTYSPGAPDDDPPPF